MRVQNKVVVVTGGGSGMGRELVLELLRRGARVAAVDINERTLAETAALAGSANLATFTLNIADRQAVEALPDQVEAQLGPVDGLINNAGIIQPFVRVAELEYAAIERVFDVNWRGPLYLTKTFLPRLLQRPEGHIVNVSSMGGFVPVPGQSVYGASKAALKLLTEALHSELADTQVRVTVVFPGAVATNIMANSGLPVPKDPPAQTAKILSADRAARLILDGMEANRFRVLVGKDARMMDALYRLNPKRTTALIARKMRNLLAPSAAKRPGDRASPTATPRPASVH